MPNGHSGVPFLGGPMVLAVMFFACCASLPFKERLGWAWVAICLIFAALAGWRLAYDLHMRDADEYGGAYAPPEVHRPARTLRSIPWVYRYRVKSEGNSWEHRSAPMPSRCPLGLKKSTFAKHFPVSLGTGKTAESL